MRMSDQYMNSEKTPYAGMIHFRFEGSTGGSSQPCGTPVFAQNAVRAREKACKGLPCRAATIICGSEKKSSVNYPAP